MKITFRVQSTVHEKIAVHERTVLLARMYSKMWIRTNIYILLLTISVVEW